MLDWFSRQFNPEWDNDLYKCHGWGMFDRFGEAMKYRTLAKLRSLDLVALCLIVGAVVGFVLAWLGLGTLLFIMICLLTCSILVGVAYIKGAEDVINQYLDNLEGDIYDKE